MPGISLSAVNERLEQAVDRLVQADKDNPSLQRTDSQLDANPYRPPSGDDGFIDAKEAASVSDPFTRQLYAASASFYGRQVWVGGGPGGFEPAVYPPGRGVERGQLRLLASHVRAILERFDAGDGALPAELDANAVEAQIRAHYAETYPASFEPKEQYVSQLRDLILSAGQPAEDAPAVGGASAPVRAGEPTTVAGVLRQAVADLLALDQANPDLTNNGWRLEANPYRTPKGDDGFVDSREARGISDELASLTYDAAAAWAGETYLEGGTDGFERKVKAPVGGLNAGGLRLVAEHVERIAREMDPADLGDRVAVETAVAQYFTARFRADRNAMRRLPFVKERVADLLVACQAQIAGDG